MITIVGTGLTRGQLTLDAAECLASGRVFFHTGRCAAAEYLAEKGIPFETLDDLYDAAEDFDEHTAFVVERLLKEEKVGDIVYAVFDMRDETVRALVDAGAPVRLIPGVPVDGKLTANVSGMVQALSAGDANDAVLSPFSDALVREIDSRELASEVKLRLMEVYPEEGEIILMHGGDVKRIPLHMLDRLKAYDHTMSAFVPAVKDVKELERHDMASLARIVRRLCDPDGCPWDREQTHESIVPNLIEEAYETVDAIERGDADSMYDELGDLLYQIMMHAEIGRRHGEFDITDVTTAISEKLIRRHPYVFADGICETEEDIHRIWREVKMQENGQTSAGETLSGVAKALPALMRAAKLSHRAAQAGMVRTREEAFSDMLRAAESADTEEGMGDLLFFAAAAAKSAGYDPEDLLRKAGERFTEDFIATELALTGDGRRLEDFAPEEIFRCFITKRQERKDHEQN